MKKLFSSFFIIGLLTVASQARILTVSNVTGSIAMFTSVQLAIDSAKAGDTVFVHASATQYAGVTIKRRLVLLGEGGKPNYTGNRSFLGSITIDTLAGIPVSGTVVMGVEASGFLIATGIRGMIIKNCYITSTTNFGGSGHIIINNILSHVITLGTNITFSNNVIPNYNVTGGTNCIISNNIFLNVNQQSYPAFQNLNNCTIVNNIIIGTGKTISGGTGSSYSKNIQAGTDMPAGNFTGIQPTNLFSESSISASMSAAQYLTARWTLISASVGKTAGTDGKDIGLYGGSFPWPSNKVFNGDPGLPNIEMVVIQNAVIAPNGILKVDFKAKSAKTK